MNISLSPELEAYVRHKMASGGYVSASEVVREALRLLEEQDKFRAMKLEELRKDIAIGVKQLDRGEFVEFTDDTLKQLLAEVRAKPSSKPGSEPRRARRKKRA